MNDEKEMFNFYSSEVGNFNIESFSNAIDDNIMIYDQVAKCKEFSPRLMCIAQTVARTYYDSVIRKIYLHIDTVNNFLEEWHEDGYDSEDMYIYGYKYGVLPNSLIDFFYHQNQNMPKDKVYLAVFEMEGGRFLLGGY